MATQGAFCAIIREGRGGPEILMPIRADGKGLNLAGGRVEEGETSEDAARREALEETGLEVEVCNQIGDDLPMIVNGEIVDIAKIYSIRAFGGELRATSESVGFRWVSLAALFEARVVQRPCPGFPKGRTYKMAELALTQCNPVLSQVIDPHELGQEQCVHWRTYRTHVCTSLTCSEQTCFGGENATICEACGELLD